MPTPAQMDREEKRRVQNLLARAKKNHEHFYVTEEFLPKKKFKRYVNIRIDGQLRHGGSMVLGDLIRRNLLAREKAEFLADPGVVLVKNGKLTPEGIARGIKLPNG